MVNIEVVGLGAGDLEQMPLHIYIKLKNATSLYLRTSDHPAAQQLAQEGIAFTSFDNVYKRYESFEETYAAIVSTLMQEHASEPIIYAVPGHPMVAEKTVQLLLEADKNGKAKVNIIGGQSFLDSLFSAVQIDPIDGCQIVDAMTVTGAELEIQHHIIVVQVYDQMMASHVKLTLMERLPDDYIVTIVHAAGSESELVRNLPLYELDRDMTMNQLTAVYVPPVQDEALLYNEFNKLRDVIAVLRGPNGCPWDRKQTHESLKKYLVEETEEVLEAIDGDDIAHLVEELGDVLLQVMLHSQIGEDNGYFTVDDVIRSTTEKMIRRHPHVFGDVQVESEEELTDLWEKIKKEEKTERD